MVTFRFITVYENPETSEVAGEFLTLGEALSHPAKPQAEVICNGTTLAKAFEGSWRLTREGMGWTEFPEAIRPKFVNGCWFSQG
jgi:hypothetical protein